MSVTLLSSSFSMILQKPDWHHFLNNFFFGPHNESQWDPILFCVFSHAGLE